MPNKFSDYVSKNTTSNVPNNLEEVINHYGNKSNDELLKEFVALSKIKKANGTLSKESIDNLRKVLFPHLTHEQQQSFEILMGEIDE